jgi:hypothetical protein
MNVIQSIRRSLAARCAMLVVILIVGAEGQKICSRNDKPRKSANEVAILAHSEWKCDDLINAVAIAGSESGFGYKCETDDPDGSIDYGIWQNNSSPKNAPAPSFCNSGSALDEVPATALADFACEVKHSGRGFNISNAFRCRNGGCPSDPTAPARWQRNLALAQAAAQQFAAECSCSATPNGCAPVPPQQTGGFLNGQIITSGDPNDKGGSQGVGTQQYIAGATPLRYVILFSNLEAATAPAQVVAISDQLDAQADDLTSFALGPIVFGSQLISPPPGISNYTTTIDLRPNSNLLVKVNANLDASVGLLTWTFTSLDPSTSQPPTDPTAGFLPPGGQGSVFFTVMPKQGLPTGTHVQNQATIVFDANQPLATQTWLNTLDNTPPTSHVSILPSVENLANFAIRWAGTDVGAGVQDFTIYVSDNSAPFVPFVTNTAATSTTFPGQPGHSYAFYSIARDFVGNLEPQKSAPDATTQVALDTTPPVTSAGISPTPNANGWNNANVTITLMSTDDEPNGTGIKQITYSATGSQNIGSTVVGGASASLTISTEGITTITFFGTDNAGNIEIPKTITIKLDKTPPTIIRSQAPVPNANGWNNTNVSVSFTCTDNLSGLAPGSPPTPTLITAEGANQSATGTCTDLAGNLATSIVQGINIDKTSPTASCNASPDVLWPPNHKLVPINVSVTVSDSLSGPAGFMLNSVTSNEPDSRRGDIQGFVIGTASTNGQLRSERLGSGNGRTYTLVYTGVDRAGNSATCNTGVSVPHDQGH